MSVACLVGNSRYMKDSRMKSHFPLMPDLGPIMLHRWCQPTLHWKEKNIFICHKTLPRRKVSLNTSWKNSHALQVPVVVLVMQWQENNLLWGWLGEWDGAGFPRLFHLSFPDQQQKGHKPLTKVHGSSGLSQGSWSVVEAILRMAGKEDMHWLFSSTEKQHFSNCSEMQTRRGLLRNISWLWGNLCYKSKLSLVDFFFHSWLTKLQTACLWNSPILWLSLLENEKANPCLAWKLFSCLFW